jgi:hypothetical protein
MKLSRIEVILNRIWLGDRVPSVREIIEQEALKIAVVLSWISACKSLNPRFASFIATPVVTLPGLHQLDVGHLHSLPRPFCPTASRAIPSNSPPPLPKVGQRVSPPRIIVWSPQPTKDCPGELLAPPQSCRKKPHWKRGSVAWVRDCSDELQPCAAVSLTYATTTSPESPAPSILKPKAKIRS